MTNEIMAAAPALMATNTVEGMTLVVRCVTPVSGAALSWLLATVLMPAIALAVFIHGKVMRQRGRQLSGHHRFLLMAGLLAVTSTLVAASTRLHDAFYFAATQDSGAAQVALLRMEIAHTCTIFKAGSLVGAFCFALALLLPWKTKEPPTTPRTVP